MSKAMAHELACLESSRMSALNPGSDDSPAEHIGSAVLATLGSAATISRVKERATDSDQQRK